MADQPKKDFAFVPSYSGTCRCGESFQVGKATGTDLTGDGKGLETGVPTIIHLKPWCDDFVKLEMIAYLRWIRLGSLN